MSRGFTLVEVAMALLLMGVVAYMVLSLSQSLRAGTFAGPEEEVLEAAEALLEAGLDAPPCGSTASPLTLTLAGKSYRVCQQPAGLSITPPSNMSVYAYTYTFVEVASDPVVSFPLTKIVWDGSPPPPPSSPNFTASCQKAEATRLRMTVANGGARVTTKTISLSWSGGGANRLTGVYLGSTTLWSGRAKKGVQITLRQDLSFGTQTLDFTFDKKFKAGTYTFTLQLWVGQGNNQVAYTVSCPVRW